MSHPRQESSLDAPDAQPGEDEPRRGRPQDADNQGDSETPAPDASESDPDVPMTEEAALLALSRGDDAAEHAQSAQVAAIANALVNRLQSQSLGMQIGTLALFNDPVSFGGGLNIATSNGRMSGGARKPRLIGPKVLSEHTRHYVPPPVFQDASLLLSDLRLLIAALPPKTGRTTFGFNLLHGALATYGAASENGGCHLIVNPSADELVEWKPHAEHSASLIVLDDGSSTPSGVNRAAVDVLDEDWIDRTTSVLLEMNSYLVLVTGPPRGPLVDTATRSPNIIESLGKVDLLGIIESRVLETRTPENAAALHGRLAEAGALEVLREIPQPEIAVQIASAIVTGGDLADRVKKLRDPTVQVHTWFSRHRDLQTTSFALAAAVLEEATYLTVSDAAMVLYEMLAPAADGAPDVRFGERLSIDHSWIDLSVDHETEVGTVPQPSRVRFRNQLVRQAVLSYAWTSLDGYRSAKVQWLRRLVGHADVEVQARAAVSAGLIAWSDVNHALYSYLRSWAGHTSIQLRQAAVTALEVVAEQPHLTESIWSLLEMWIAEQTLAVDQRRSFTATTALGGRLGATDPTRAIAALHTVLAGDGWASLLPASRSLVRLIEQGCVSEVLSALLDWSQPQDGSPMVTKALSAFVFAARQPAPEAGPAYPGAEIGGGGTPGTNDRPLPLLLAQGEWHRPQIAELWARALARKPVQPQALEALRHCLDTYANEDPSAFHNLRGIVHDIAARQGRHRQRLEWYLDAWAHDDLHPSAVAERIHSELRDPEEIVLRHTRVRPN